MCSDAPLDLKIKASMIADMFSLVGECIRTAAAVHLFSMVLHLLLIQMIQKLLRRTKNGIIVMDSN